MEVQSAIIRRLDQSNQSLTGEVRALAAQQEVQAHFAARGAQMFGASSEPLCRLLDGELE